MEGIGKNKGRHRKQRLQLAEAEGMGEGESRQYAGWGASRKPGQGESHQALGQGDLPRGAQEDDGAYLEWLARGREKGIDEVQRVIEAEYHIVTDGEGSSGSDAPTFTRNGQPDWAKFWAYQKEKGLDEEKVHAMVGVSSLKEDWVGKGRTLEEADEAIKRALEAEKARPAVKRDPETIKSINSLLRACNEDFGLQPRQVLAELGVSSQNELTELPSESYRRIAAVR